MASLKKVKVLQVITTTIGGAGEHVLQLSRGLISRGFDVEVAFTPGMPLDDAFARDGIRVHPVPMRRTASPTSLVRALPTLRTIIKKSQHDIVHTHTSVAGAVGRLAAAGLGVKSVIHMIHALPGHKFVPQPRRAIYTAVERGLRPLTDFYIAGSDALRRKAIETCGISEDRIQLIYYALDIDRHDASAVEPASARKSLAIPESAPVIALLGRLEQQKGVETYIELVSRLSPRFPDLVALIVGDGPLRGALEKQVVVRRQESRIRFLGWRKDVAVVLAASDMLVIPSRWEAFGIVNLEAMASRRPVVGYAVEGIPEVVKHGETGLLVPTENIDALTHAAQKLLENEALRRAMGVAGRRRLEELFPIDRMVGQHEELYSRLLDDSGAAARITRPTRA